MWALALTALLCVPSPGTAGPDRSREYQLKAAFLFNFTRFVEWSSVRAPAKDAAFELCVAADAAVYDEIHGAVGNRLLVKRITNAKHTRPCHLIFVADSKRGQLSAFTAAASRWDALLVSEAARFGEPIGMINLVVVENRIRVEVDLEAVQAANLSISSKLLSLATLRGGRPR